MSKLESGPREAGGSNPSKCHEPESRRENGLTSTIGKRHAERMRTCFAQVIGKAVTDPLERRNRRRTEADDVERFLTLCRDHGAMEAPEVSDKAHLYTPPSREEAS